MGITFGRQHAERGLAPSMHTADYFFFALKGSGHKNGGKEQKEREKTKREGKTKKEGINKKGKKKKEGK